MIESNIIKRYIVKVFIQNSCLDITDIASNVISTLEKKYFLNESVCITSTKTYGKISHCCKDAYKVITPNGEEVEATLDQLQRQNLVYYEDVLYFLDYVTVPTAFGRVLIENVFERIPYVGTEDQGADCAPGSGRDRDYHKGYIEGCGAGLKYSDVVMGRTVPAREYEGCEPAAQYTKKRSKRGEGSYTGGTSKKHKEVAHQTTTPAEVAPPAEALDISKLKKLSVDRFEGEQLNLLVKIYLFLTNFNTEFKFGDFDISELGKRINDAEYTSELAFKVHSTLVELLENEMKTKKERFYETVEFVVNALPPSEVEGTDQATKKRVSMTQDNWRAQTKIFIQNWGKDSDNDKLLQFCTFYKKDSVVLRLSFISFLIDCTTLTDRFREIIATKQAALKAARSKYDEITTLRRKKGEADQARLEKLVGDLESQGAMLCKNPLKVYLGKYIDYTTFIMDTKLYLKASNDIFILEKEDVKTMLYSLSSHTKAEKTLSTNLKACMENLLRPN